MLPAKSSGLTTQKIVLSFRKGSASRTVSTVTNTWVKSGETVMVFTVPITTFLYLSWDWPAVRPAPGAGPRAQDLGGVDLKRREIGAGPACRDDLVGAHQYPARTTHPIAFAHFASGIATAV